MQVEPATFQGSNICVKLWVLAIKMTSPVLENSMLFTIEAAILDRPGGPPPTHEQSSSEKIIISNNSQTGYNNIIDFQTLCTAV